MARNVLCGQYEYAFFFFFQAEDGIRDYKVTGVQTCALPISAQPQSATPGGGRAGSARRQSLPLRHPQPDHPRRPARRATEREDLTMDAPRLTRRDFTAALGGILSFSLVPKVALVQEPARLPGSLQTNRTLDAWL